MTNQALFSIGNLPSDVDVAAFLVFFLFGSGSKFPAEIYSHCELYHRTLRLKMDSGIVLKNLDSDCSASYEAAKACTNGIIKLFEDELPMNTNDGFQLIS